MSAHEWKCPWCRTHSPSTFEVCQCCTAPRTDSDALREAIADELASWYPDHWTGQSYTHSEHLDVADALLDGPLAPFREATA